MERSVNECKRTANRERDRQTDRQRDREREADEWEVGKK